MSFHHVKWSTGAINRLYDDNNDDDGTKAWEMNRQFLFVFRVCVFVCVSIVTSAYSLHTFC